MALQEYLGSIVMEIDGREVEVESLDVTFKTGRKLVKTMNRTGRAKGFAKGIGVSGDVNWAAIEGAKITIYPLTDGGSRTSYLDCFTTDVGRKYTVDNEAKQDLSMVALREVVE